jgi:hypothetical protein
VDDDYALYDSITLTPTVTRPVIAASSLSGRQGAVVTGDMMHHASRCRELDWSLDPKEAGCRAGGFARRREHTATANPFPSPKVWRRQTATVSYTGASWSIGARSRGGTIAMLKMSAPHEALCRRYRRLQHPRECPAGA